MHGVFYFTRSPLTLDDIARLAQQSGHLCRSHEEPGDSQRRTLTVVCAGDRWEWRENSESADEPGAAVFNQHILSAYEPVAAFHIAGCSRSLARLGEFLHAVLESYGGWVGYGDDWVETYDARNIHCLPALA